MVAVVVVGAVKVPLVEPVEPVDKVALSVLPEPLGARARPVIEAAVALEVRDD
jgi:hypothetical protein